MSRDQQLKNTCALDATLSRQPEARRQCQHTAEPQAGLGVPSLRALGVASTVTFTLLSGSGKSGSAGGMTWLVSMSVTA